MGEVPLLKELFSKYREQGAAFLGVSLDEDVNALDRMVRQKEIPWPQIADGKADEGEVPKAFHVTDFPSFYVLDRAGRIFARLKSAKEIEAQLKEALALPVDAPPRQERDVWQRPMQVMDALGVSAGSKVADVGAGGGYFTFHLASRVGATGRVFAEDIEAKPLEQLRAKLNERGLKQVETILGKEDDPSLPMNAADAVLIVDAYHEFRRPDPMLSNIFRSLKQGGRMAILDRTGPLAKPRSEYNDQHHIPAETIIEDAARAGFRLKRFEPEFVRYSGEEPSYLIVFEKP